MTLPVTNSVEVRRFEGTDAGWENKQGCGGPARLPTRITSSSKQE